jgi:hypothetical protein
MKARECKTWRAVGPIIVKRLITLLATLTLVVPVASLAASVVVGAMPITIPDPSGFAPVTPQMKSAFELQKQSAPPGVEQFESYIPTSEVQNALDDAGDLNLNRRFDVDAARKSLNLYFTLSDFSQLKEVIRNQNDEIVRRAKQEFPQVMENLNSYIARGSGIEKAISVMDVIALPPHEETARTVSYSLFEKFSVKNNAGAPTIHVAAATITYLYVKGKILILHCFAEKQGLEWSRSALKQWADAIMAANST